MPKKLFMQNKLKFEGKIFDSTSFGKFEVTEYVNKEKVCVKFLATGYETSAKTSHILSGKVKDPYYPHIFERGYIGKGKYKSRENKKITKPYQLWHGMMSRCYDEKKHRRQPTYKGCTVDPRWFNFQVFAAWWEDNYIEGYELDKDIKVDGNKVYGPDTCMFVSCQKNNEKANAKHWKFLSPEGELFKIYNLKKFCAERGLHDGCMNYVNYGKLNHHQGWTAYKETT